jgi:hypothetical protein
MPALNLILVLATEGLGLAHTPEQRPDILLSLGFETKVWIGTLKKKADSISGPRMGI